MTGPVAVIIPAGGSGARMGGLRKQFATLAGEPMLVHALRPFLELADVRRVVVALPADTAADPPSWLRDLDARIRTVAGGRERGDSVRSGLAAVPDDTAVVMVHDAARPLVGPDVIARVLAAVGPASGAIAALPVGDTLKRVGAGGRIETTVDRADLWRAQTPQAFPFAVLRDAYARAAAEHAGATDCAALVERCGGSVVVVEGSPENIKVTSPADLPLAQALLRARTHGAP